MTEIKKIVIQKCPLCGNKHTYQLIIERISVLRNMVTSDLFKQEKPQKVRFQRLLICPVKNAKYKVTISMHQTSDDKISSLKVGDIIEE